MNRRFREVIENKLFFPLPWMCFRACFDKASGHTCSMNEEVDARLTRLESTIAHLEYLTEQLNGVVIEQGRQLDLLRKQLQRQSQTLETIEMERIKTTNPKPPHYR